MGAFRQLIVACRRAGRRAASTAAARTLAFGAVLGTAAIAVAAPAPKPTHARTPLSPQAQKALLEVLKDGERFKAAADSFRGTVNSIVKRAYEKRRRGLASKYEGKIRKEEVEERTRRLSAIALFEDFLRRYPKDRRWTPDVIFRLAELYFEKSHDEYLLATDRYEKDFKAFEAGKLAGAPTQPKQSYQQTVDLHRRLIREFPRYRLVDGAYYLLGFCLSEMGDVIKGKEAFLSLVCSNKHRPPLADDPIAPPDPAAKKSRKKFDTTSYNDCRALYPQSRFNPEAWIRIGEHHFDENELGQAIAAYRRVISIGAKDNAYYDEALYKLAWTYYRADKFAEAIKNFDELVVYADTEQEKTGKAGSEMRPEAVQYLGVSFAEEDWDGDSIPDKETGLERIEKFYAGREKEKHVFDVYRRLADIYYDTTKYELAIKIYKAAMQRWPLRSENPELQDRVITANERLRKFDVAIKEREEFTKLFGKNTSWEKANRNNTKALRKAREFDEQALIQAAVHHHTAAQNLKKRGLALGKPKLLEDAANEYKLAATAYERYLERFPDSKNAYEIRFSYASCLFFSQRWLDAAVEFGKVRDSNLDDRYREEAAFSAAKAYEEFIDNQAKENKLIKPDVPKADKPPANLAAIPLPEPWKKWQQALDAYARVLPKSPKTPTLTYKAAEISFRFLNFTDARKRFTDIYQKHCKEVLAGNSAQAILVTYKLEKNLDKMEQWAKNIQSQKCSVGGKAADEAGSLLTGIQFKRAEDLFKAKQWDKAAAAYLALVDKNPKSKDAPAALNNAAVAYEESKRYESATKIYERIWQNYPDSDLADKALWRSAFNYSRFFNFKKAVTNYLLLADSDRFKSSVHRTDAIYNAAQILENDQEYARSAQLFLRYSRAVGKPKEAAEAYFRAGEIYEKMKDNSAMTRVFRDFPSRHGGAPGQGGRAVEAYFRIGNAAHKRKDMATAVKYYRRAIQEYQSRGQQAGSDAAEHAAQAAFEIAERRLVGFLKTKILGPINTLVAKEKKLVAQAKALQAEYERIWSYKSGRWTLAAMFRGGVIFQHVALSLDEGYRKAPLPPKLKKLPPDLRQEATDIYMQNVEKVLGERVDPIAATAKKLFEACIAKAKEFGLSNQYTEEALVRLNALDPQAYPVLKKPKIEVLLD